MAFKLQDKNEQELSFKFNLKLVLVVVFLTYVFVVFAKVVLDYFCTYLGFETNFQKTVTDFNLIRSSLAILIIAPIFEELLFRLHLNFNRLNLFFSILILISLLVSQLINNGFQYLYVFLFLFYFIYIIITYLNKNYISKKTYLIFFHVIINSLFFSIFHMLNIDDFKIENFIEYLFYVMPMFVFGISFSYIRIRTNIFWAIFAHFLSNLLPFSILILKHYA